MAKVKIDLKSLDIPTVAQKPLYAGVGAGDLAVAAVRDYVTVVQTRVAGFEPKSLRKQAAGRVTELQADAKALPSKVQDVVSDNVATLTGTYADLVKHGEAVFKGTKTPSSASVEVKLNTTNPGATKGAQKPAAKKSPARRAAAKKSSAKRATAKTAG